MSESNGEFNFDLITRKCIPVQYQGKKYVLWDASEQATIEYEETRRKIVRDGDNVRFVPSDDLEKAASVLISNCLRDDKGGFVPVTDLREWPHHTIETMFQWIVDNTPGMKIKDDRESLLKEKEKIEKRLKALDKPTLEEQAKNSPNATAVG